MTTKLAALAAGSIAGLGLTWLSVFYLFPQLEDTLYHLELPHADIHLHIHQ